MSELMLAVMDASVWSDFAILESQWLEVPGIPSADIAPEPVVGVVNLTDLAVVATYWLESGCI